MPALMIARVSVKDPDKFQDYVSKAGPTMAEFGGETMFRGKIDKYLTGDAPKHEITAIFKFPSVEKVEEWYASDAYQALIPSRDEAADFQFISYEMMG